MRQYLRVFLLLLPGAAAAQTSTPLVPARPPLTSVVVYLNGTSLEHKGQVQLPAGLSRLVFDNLSAKIKSESLELQLGPAAELVSLDAADELPASPANQPALDSLRRTRDEIEQVEAELKGLEEEKVFLQANRTLPAGTQANWSAEVQKGATLLRTRTAAILRETQRLQLRQTELKKQATLLEPRTANDPGDRVVALVRTKQAGPVPLTVRYYVGSRMPWQPKLEIRADEAGRELRFDPHGMLRNQSGLAWQQVRLTIMNYALAEDVSRPQLEPWALDFNGGDHIGEGRIDEFVVKGTAKGQPANVAQSTRYEVPEPITLAVGGRRDVSLPPLRLSARPEYLALPKLSDKVYLTAKATGWEGLHLPEDAAVYHKGGYVGQVDLNERAYNDSLEVTLGYDEQVVVSRTKLKDFSGKAGLSGKRRVQLAYELNVRNRHAEPIRIRIQDQIPVASEKEIEVKALETSGAQLDERTGRLTWVLTLAPGTSQRLGFSFQVDYPQDKEVEIIQHRATIKSPKFR
ncbi:DUF4139 domain-containing protein [Hymenobacter canadensis]|uniref:DUF4139 domain-containing protein n=1 Tax=Hymenobacter canadensis TaxID=2999067 RepID=A0ABY7LQT5_9BACT|nr:DUF4139 domain-containing protein [Hymenobacter canadensis]WBA41258.1 DUF4139 domain-containing protein [Hymenobacter canadensis]